MLQRDNLLREGGGEIEYVKIPKERVAVLIGKSGGVRKEVEDLLNVSLNIDAEEGVVTIENAGEDVLAEWTCRDIIKAIGRGMNPKKAMLLASDEYVLDLVDLTELVGRSRKHLQRQKGRIIGTGGKTRKIIEETTGAALSIYGKTVAIIGTAEETAVAKEAVVMLCKGIPHGVVYKTLQRKSPELKKARMQLWKKSF